MQVNITKLHPLAILPTYAYDGDAGADLYSIESIVVLPKSIRLISTGLSIEIPQGYEGQIRSRSGLAAKHQIAVLNSPGTIDSGYTGEIKVLLINHSSEYYRVEVGDRIAQLVIAPVIRAEFQEVAAIGVESDRGDGGFGSSGIYLVI